MLSGGIGTFGTVHIDVNNKTFPLSLDCIRERIHTRYEDALRRNTDDLLYKEDTGTGSVKATYRGIADYRERPLSFSVVESPPDGILKRLNNGQPAEVKEAAEKLREYAAGLYNGHAGSTPELRYLAGRVCRRMRAIYPLMPQWKLIDMAKDLTGEIVSDGYIKALEQLSNRDAQTQLDYVKYVAESIEASETGVLLFGVRLAGDSRRYRYAGGTDRALAAYINRESLRGVHRPGLRNEKAYRERFKSTKSRAAFDSATRLVRPWPVHTDKDGNPAEVEIDAGKGKLPADSDTVTRESYRALGRAIPYTIGVRRLSGDQSYGMVENLASAILHDPEQPPLLPEQLYAFDELVTEANQKSIDPWAYVTEEMPEIIGTLGSVWEKSREKLYSATMERYERMTDLPGKAPRLEAWPSWKKELQRLEKISTDPQLRIVYPPQLSVKRRDDRGAGCSVLEKRYGLRVPAKHTRLINTLKKNPWFAANCDVVYNDTRPYATRDIARLSLGEEYDPGKRYEIAGSWGIDGDTERGRITIYRGGFNRSQTLAEEVYHAVYDIIRSTNNGFGEKVECLAHKYAKSKSPDEAFAGAMAAETVSRGSSRLPKRVVTDAVDIVNGNRSIPGDAMEQIKKKRGIKISY